MKVFQALVLALAATVLGAAPLLPSEDPFYSPPTQSSLAQASPGTVLRSRVVPSNLQGIVPNVTINIKEIHQLLYRTTDSNGKAVAAVTSVLIPKNADPSKLLAYQTAYDSANNNCSPSYGLQAGANTSEVSDIIFIVAALNRGWYVSTSDYEGLEAQYTAGVQSGQATLDSVRATLNSASAVGLSSKAKYALWGYSGGSLASEWAAELQPSYAPELHFEGVALGGLIPNVTNVLLTINKGPFSGLAFSGMRGLSAAYPDLGAYIQSNLKPGKSADFNRISNLCLSQASSQGANMDLFSYFKNGEQTIYAPLPKKYLLEAGQMGRHGVPMPPLFFYKALGDEISPASDTTDLYNTLCSKGAAIEYHLDLVGEHITEAITGSASAFAWIADRLAGIPTSRACSLLPVTLTSVNLQTVGALGGEIIALLENLL